jgi:hypothetical protein
MQHATMHRKVDKTFKILITYPEGKIRQQYLGVDDMLLLKWTLKEIISEDTD